MVQAMDRQGMVDTLMQGQSTVAESFLNPGFAGHDIVDPYIVHYPYDQRAAQQAIASLGYTRGSDGIFRGADGQPLSLELRVAAGDDLNQKATLSVANDWKNAGVDVQPAIIPGSRVTDLEYTATFPAFTFTRFKNDLSRLNKFGTKNTPLPANNYRITGNTPRYMDPAFDALLDRYFVTIPKQDRMQLVGQIIHTMTDQVIQMTLFFVTEPTVLSNRLVNVEGAREGVSMTWNAEKWDVKS
jgi:ABC-type transport system substrate-binding protein